MSQLPSKGELREAIRHYSMESSDKGLVLSLQAWAVLLDMLEAQAGLLVDLRAELAAIRHRKAGKQNV